MSDYAFHRQPLKGLYLTYQLVTTLFIRFPYWVLLAIPRSWRPRESWSLKQTLLIALIRHLSEVQRSCGSIIKRPDHLAIGPGLNVNGVWIAATPELVTGELKTWADAASVSSIRIPGYWIHKNGSKVKVAAPPQAGEKIVYALHGGGYVRLSAHPTDPTATIARGLVEHIEPVQRVFSVEYRLSATTPFKPAAPFPAALLDALAGYNYLVNIVGFSPSDIIIEGDSAGGNLAHALTRYLVEYGDSSDVDLPGPPGALILLSPWVDMGASHDNIPGGSAKRFADDIIPLPVTGALNYSKISFFGPHDETFADKNKYISPASLDPSFKVDFNGFPRTFIVAGGAEMLLDQIRTFKDRMIKDLGEGNGVKEGEGKVRYYEAPDSVHDYLVFLWHEPARTKTLKEIAKWAIAS